MLFRQSLRASPAVLCFLLFCLFLGYQLSNGTPPRQTGDEDKKANAPQEQSQPQPKKPRIGIVTFITDQKSYLHLSLKNKDRYARLHGYDFIVEYEMHHERGVGFWKFAMLERLIQSGEYDWLWWMDFDTLITNTEIKVEDVIAETLASVEKPDDIDYMFTHDCNGLNSGSYLVRAHERSLLFMNSVYRLDDELKEQSKEQHQLSEQDVMSKLLERVQEARDRSIQVPQWKLNAFPPEIACYDEAKRPWEHGMFVIHFAGAWAHVKGDDPTGQLMKKYEPEIIWGNWENMY